MYVHLYQLAILYEQYTLDMENLNLSFHLFFKYQYLLIIMHYWELTYIYIIYVKRFLMDVA